MAKLTADELVRLKKTARDSIDFISVRSNGKVLERTTWVHPATGKKRFATGWRVAYRTENWKRMDERKQDDVVSGIIQRERDRGYEIVAGTRSTAVG